MTVATHNSPLMILSSRYVHPGILLSGSNHFLVTLFTAGFGISQALLNRMDARLLLLETSFCRPLEESGRGLQWCGLGSRCSARLSLAVGLPWIGVGPGILICCWYGDRGQGLRNCSGLYKGLRSRAIGDRDNEDGLIVESQAS